MSIELRNNSELQKVAQACLDYGNAVVCFSWVARRYRTRFGGTFHQSRLAELERLGVLRKDGDTSRGGHRRDLRRSRSARIARLLRGCNPTSTKAPMTSRSKNNTPRFR